MEKTAGLPRCARNDGFTLAEVLITLVIIGVIAAITVPTLITKYQKEQTVTRLKKTYSVINQALQKSLINNPNQKTWAVENNSAESMKKFQQEYLSSLQITKTFEGTLDNYNPVYMDNTLDGALTSDRCIHYILNDGVLLNTYVNAWINENDYTLNFIIDINGFNKPNKVGRDIFYFNYSPTINNIIHPHGYQSSLNLAYNRTIMLDESHSNNCNKNKHGSRCSAVIMIDGWQIKDDYPW